MKHYLVTRWNCDLYDLNWLKRRQKVFERFCLPSVMSQTQKDFEWLLISDSRTPDEFRVVLDSYPATVIYPKFNSYQFEIPDVIKEDTSEVMKRSIKLECIREIVAEHIGVQDTEYVITSRCDNDDAISIDHISKIQKFAEANWHGESFWLSLTQGYKWRDGIAYSVHSVYNPFITLVETPQNLNTCYKTCHTLVRDAVEKTVAIGSCLPTWLQVVHGDNLMNRVRRVMDEFPEEYVRGRFKYND